MSSTLTVMADKMAVRFGLEPDGEVLDVLKMTCFRVQGDAPPATDAQMTALLIVANQYGLNPWTKEIFAFPDKRGGIVPVVGVDGWARIINEHPQFDGIEFAYTDGEATCTIYRKDRSHPTVVTEYLDECKRGTDPWKSHPRRMLRHKAMIQCARLAFGFVGIFDGDEAERIVDGSIDASTGEIRSAAKHMGAAQTAEATVSIPPELLADARAAAKHGVTAYEAFWTKTGPDNRRLLRGEHEALKVLASTADRDRTIDAMPPAGADDFVRDIERAEQVRV